MTTKTKKNLRSTDVSAAGKKPVTDLSHIQMEQLKPVHISSVYCSTAMATKRKYMFLRPRITTRTLMKSTPQSMCLTVRMRWITKTRNRAQMIVCIFPNRSEAWRLKPNIKRSLLRSAPTEIWPSVTGASLGGLETFYITMEYPEIFGTAGSLSPSFWTYNDEAWRDYLGEKYFSNNTPFIYLYTGPAGGDTDPYVTEMYNRLKDMGYPTDKISFHYNENGGHHSNYWRAYFSEFLTAMAFQCVEPLQE